MARALAKSGYSVLAIDGDSNPNLALTLGIGAESFDDVPTLPRGLVERTDAGPRLTKPLEEVCASHSLEGPDGVTLLVMAHPEHAGTGCLCSMHTTVRTLIEAASARAEDVCILDTEASPEHLSRGTAKYADVMLCVIEPYFKSLETGRRMAELGKDLGLGRVALVANKVRDDRELEAVHQFAESKGLELAGVIPYDEQMPAAEYAAAAPFDFAPDAPAVAAIGQLAEQVVVNGRG